MQANNKLPRVNWPQHANAIEGSSSKDDFLSSSFLFSLPTQRPNPEANREGMLSLRYALIYAKQIGYTKSERNHCLYFSGLLLVKFKAQSVFKFCGSRRYSYYAG